MLLKARCTSDYGGSDEAGSTRIEPASPSGASLKRDFTYPPQFAEVRLDSAKFWQRARNEW